MERIIASTYRIIKELGSGGMGVVYLGYHERLKQNVVLKADKRELTASSARLRQEVDVLKGLHHTNLPQVYDYVQVYDSVQEKDIVYTVMDYIEGESLDKPLERGETFKQPEVIEWACELLEALRYLHNQEPPILHADIKPANIMLTEQNEIRLIDFNIALALRENDAIHTGRSEGYASPEHYGLDYRTRKLNDGASDNTQTIAIEDETSSSSGSGSSYNPNISLDVRSDIYSLGATLYHFLTGERPNKDALKVRPISEWKHISPQVAQIISKAMNPNPDLRYQSADEMLWAFEHLHENDQRTRRHKRRAVLSGLLCASVLALGGFLTFVGLRQLEQLKGNQVLAAESAEAMRKGDVDTALEKALDALPEHLSFLDPPYTAEAQRALASAAGVYDLRDGYKAYKSIPLIGEVSQEPVRPVKAALSPDGTLAAVLTNELENWSIHVYSTVSGKEMLDPLPAAPSATDDFIFTDNFTLLYAGASGLTCCDLRDGGHELWNTGRPVTNIALSGSGRLAATVYRDDKSAAIWNTATGEKLGNDVVFPDGRAMRVLTADWKNDMDLSLFALDAEGNHMAVSFADGSVMLYNLENGEEYSIVDPHETDCVHFEGGFSGHFFALAMSGGSTSYFMLIDLTDMQRANFDQNTRAFHLQTDESGVYLSMPYNGAICKINPYAETKEEVIERKLAVLDCEISSFVHRDNRTLVLTTDGAWRLFNENGLLTARLSSASRIDFADFAEQILILTNRDIPSLLVQRWEEHPDRPDMLTFHYPASFLHFDANVHTDGETALLFRGECFIIVKRNGELVTPEPVGIPDSEQIRDEQYRRTGETDRMENAVEQDFLEVWYYDGLVRGYSAKTGELLFEKQGPLPETLGGSKLRNEEIMETEDYRVVSPVLNGTPKVYDRKADKKDDPIGVLEADGGLVYIYQVGDRLITHYMANDQTRFGMLLDRNLQILADFPDLSDVMPDGTIILDDNKGTLRQSRIYSIEELIARGKEIKEASK